MFHNIHACIRSMISTTWIKTKVDEKQQESRNENFEKSEHKTDLFMKIETGHCCS